MNPFQPANVPHGWQSRPTDQDQNSPLHPWDGSAIRGTYIFYRNVATDAARKADALSFQALENG